MDSFGTRCEIYLQLREIHANVTHELSVCRGRMLVVDHAYYDYEAGKPKILAEVGVGALFIGFLANEGLIIGKGGRTLYNELLVL